MILYFTGTGNSRCLAKLLAEKLQDECVDSVPYMKAGNPGFFESEKPYIFVFPTYAYRMPHIFEAFIRSCSLEGSRKAYFIMDCGADIGNAAQYLQKLCVDEALEYMGVLPVVMPDNYIALYSGTSEDEEGPIIRNGAAEVLEAAEVILKGERFEGPEAGLMDKAKSGFINQAFYTLMVKSRKFRVTDACISCGLCEKSCPLNNIKMADGRPEWSDVCTHCMACICKCPKRAIEYGYGTRYRRRYYLSEAKAAKYLEKKGRPDSNK